MLNNTQIIFTPLRL